MAREMKDSGVEWIGEVPREWKCVRIKQLANKDIENSFVDGDWIESPYIVEDGIRYLTTGNIGDGIYKKQGNGYISLETFKTLNCKYAYAGDLVFSRLNAPYGRSCILPNDCDKYVLAVDNVILRPIDNALKTYICFFTQCKGYQNSVSDHAKGTTMKRISRSNLGNIYILLPSKAEQQKIAVFLNEKVGEIDSVIAKTKESIEDYKRYKKAIITDAVTKGLNPDVEMKESGIEWIGEIPIEWTTIQLKYLLADETNNIKVGPFGSQLSGNDFVDDGYWVYNQRTVIDNNFKCNDICISKEKYDSMKGFQVFQDDILITTRGTIGRICRIPMDFYNGIIHPCIIKFRINEDKIIYSLLELVFNHTDLIKTQLSYKSNATTIDVIYKETLKNIILPLQPLREQIKIAAYLDAKCSEIDKLIAKKEELLADLESYKKSLIYEYVTGKEEVE